MADPLNTERAALLFVDIDLSVVFTDLQDKSIDDTM